MTRAKVTCQVDGEVIVEAKALIIDDAESVYRFTCPVCRRSFDKYMDEEIRRILRGAQVATLEEVVQSGAVALESDEAIWSGLLKT